MGIAKRIADRMPTGKCRCSGFTPSSRCPSPRTRTSATLKAGIIAKLWPLPNDTAVFPGHGASTTIGREKRMNPFVGVDA